MICDYTQCSYSPSTHEGVHQVGLSTRSQQKQGLGGGKCFWGLLFLSPDLGGGYTNSFCEKLLNCLFIIYALCFALFCQRLKKKKDKRQHM